MPGQSWRGHVKAELRTLQIVGALSVGHGATLRIDMLGPLQLIVDLQAHRPSGYTVLRGTLFVDVIPAPAERGVERLLGVVGRRQLTPAGAAAHEPAAVEAVVNGRTHAAVVALVVVDRVVVRLVRVVVRHTRYPDHTIGVDPQSCAYVARERGIASAVQSQSAVDKRVRPTSSGNRSPGHDVLCCGT